MKLKKIIKLLPFGKKEPHKRGPLITKNGTKKVSTLFCGLCILLLISTMVCAQKTEQIEQTEQIAKPFRHSISLSSFILLGSLQVNYEYLLAKRHGLVAEGYYAFAGTSANSWTTGLSYRYHFNPSLKGLFVNAFYRYSPEFNNTYKIKEDNNTNTYNLKTQLNVLGLGVGYRWQWKNGLAAVVRGGYGYQINPTYNWTPSLPEDNSDKTSREAQLGLDLELSVGYSF